MNEDQSIEITANSIEADSAPGTPEIEPESLPIPIEQQVRSEQIAPLEDAEREMHRISQGKFDQRVR